MERKRVITIGLISGLNEQLEDIFWVKDKSLADLDNLPSPHVLAADIIENLQSELEGFQELKQQLK